MNDQGVILFAHGSREPRWAEPFQDIERRVRAAVPDVAVRLAYLERMEPDLPGALQALAANGAKRVTVVPLFLGQGGHLRDDLPRLVRAIAEEYPDLEVQLAPVAGESPLVLEALARYCVQALGKP